MTRKSLLMIAVLTALPAGTAFAATQSAAPADPAPHRGFDGNGLDKNGDGFIDRAEAAASPRLAGKFDELDGNKDGKLARAELPWRGHGHPGMGGHGRAMLDTLDTDKDGRISLAEAQAGDGKLAERFARMDANKDGYIDRADREVHARQRRDDWFAKADTDKDGKLSKAEFDAAGSFGRGHGPRRGHDEGDHGHHGGDGQHMPTLPTAKAGEK